MSYQFRNLDQSIRAEMLHELDSDLRDNVVYVSKRLTDKGQEFFRNFLTRSFISYDNTWLANSLRQGEYWNPTETKQRPGISYEAKIPSNAPEVLADTEFNRYYMRAVCVKALQAGINDVVVYRAKESSRPRPEHDALVGQKYNAQALLEQLRKGEAELCVPNCGLSICLSGELK